MDSPEPKRHWRLLLRVWQFVRPNRGLLALLTLCFVFNQATTVVVPVAMGQVLDKIIPGGDKDGLNLMVQILAAFLILKSLLAFLERELSVLVGSFIVRDVRIKLHAHFLNMSLRFLDDYQVGRVVSRIMGDTECVKNLVITGLLNTSASLIRFVFVLGTLFYLDWRLTLLTCSILPIFMVTFWRFANNSKPAYSELNNDGASLFSSVNETFSGVRVVKTYGGERRANGAMLGRMHDILRKSLKISRSQHLISVIWDGTAWLSLIALVWYGGHRVIEQTMSIGELVAFYGLLGQMQGPIVDLININATLQPALASIEQIEHVLQTDPEIVDRPNAIKAEALRGDIQFSNVDFTYKTPRQDQIKDPMQALLEARRNRVRTVEDITFHVNAGECVAIIGASGSGKSTLLNLLARFYDIDGGSIRVDGVDIRDYKLSSYLKNFAIVLQDNFLFRGTIRDNIRYSRIDASEAEIVRAAKQAGAWDFIQDLPDGLNTWCAERGVSLSGGQKQRLSIARAILANPRILILDEATSALDSHTEAQIQGALEELMHDRTTFIVAHRLSTIVGADKIIVMDHGRIIESGTHAELLARGAHYAAMFNEQFGKVQEQFQSIAQSVNEGTITQTRMTVSNPTEITVQSKRIIRKSLAAKSIEVDTRQPDEV